MFPRVHLRERFKAATKVMPVLYNDTVTVILSGSPSVEVTLSFRGQDCCQNSDSAALDGIFRHASGIEPSEERNPGIRVQGTETSR
jgi:hypothetical protein